MWRHEIFYRPNSAWRFAAGIDARTDTHFQDERKLHLSWWDREIRRPAFEVRRLSAAWHRGPLTVELGKQFVRWGKADILNPTDRFAPQDFINVVDNDFLGVWAARVTFERGNDTVDAIYQPLFTPARIPLFNQRWTVLPENLPPDLRVIDAGARYPGRGNTGVRWNHIGRGMEYSLSFYDGYNYLPLMQATPFIDPLTSGSATTPPESAGVPPPTPAVALQRFYAPLRMFGGDLAMPLRPFTVKAEAGYFTSTMPQADRYGLYVIQLERMVREWSFVGGYAGEVVTRSRSTLEFAPDRGLARAFLGRATYTIDTNRSIAFEGALRQNGKGVWLKFEYSRAMGEHWRTTLDFTLIRGDASDFLGQYRLNSHGLGAVRYSY